MAGRPVVRRCDAGVAQEAARRRATRRVALAAHVSVRGMAEAGRLTVGGRVARLRANGLGDTRGASGTSPNNHLRFRQRPRIRKKRNARIFKSGRTNTDLEKDLGFRLRLLQAKATAAFLPLPALLEEINALKALQDIALRGNLAGTLKRCMLAHFFLPFNR